MTSFRLVVIAKEITEFIERPELLSGVFFLRGGIINAENRTITNPTSETPMKRFIACVVAVGLVGNVGAAVHRTSAEVPLQTFVMSPVIPPGEYVSWRNIMWENHMPTACQVWARTDDTAFVISCIGREDTYGDLKQFVPNVNLITISP
jgi:hypothetical protein